jgi:hypothetical protein
MPVRKKAVLSGSKVQRPSGFIQHDKIIAGALHFGELDSHPAIIPALPGKGQRD